MRRVRTARSTRRAQDVTSAEYWQDVKLIAEEAKDRESQGEDVYDVVHEEVDGSQWIIYYYRAVKVIEYSDNEEALDNEGMEVDTSQGLSHILTQYAYFAMVADVMEAYNDLPDLEDDDDEDEDEDY